MHADVAGAAVTIIKNHEPARPLSPLALAQAGTAAICRSKAWDSKIVTSAWWAPAAAVGRGAAPAPGAFAVAARNKNFLPPAPLVMGFTVLFRLADDSLARHAGERAIVASVEDSAGGAEAAGPTEEQNGAAAGTSSEGSSTHEAQEADVDVSREAQERSGSGEEEDTHSGSQGQAHDRGEEGASSGSDSDAETAGDGGSAQEQADSRRTDSGARVSEGAGKAAKEQSEAEAMLSKFDRYAAPAYCISCDCALVAWLPSPCQ